MNYASSLITAKRYIEDLKLWFEATSDEIFLSNLKICSEDLNTIIKSSSECKTLIISRSTIDTSGLLDFSIDTEYKIKFLSFQCCGYGDRSNWVKKKHELFKILKAINQCDLKYSLKSISLHHFDNQYLGSLKELRKLAEEAGLQGDMIVNDKWGPIEA